MYSFSKIPLTVESARAIVTRHFGSATRLAAFEELKDGFFNAAALLELEDGRKLVLKAAPPDEVRVLRYERDILRAEVEVMRLVGAKTSVPVPEILAYDTSRSLLTSDFFMMSFLPGVPFNKLRGSLSTQDQARILSEMGRLTRTLSEVTGPSFGCWSQPEPVGVSWRACFDHMLQGVLQDGQDAGVDLHLPYEEIYRRLEKNFGGLDVVQIPCLVHWDLWDGNIFVDPHTLQITGLIDFERALWGDPLIEAIFGDCDPVSPCALGFGGGILSSPESQIRRLLYNIYLHLIMVIECTYRRYATPDQENWVRPILDDELRRLA